MRLVTREGAANWYVSGEHPVTIEHSLFEVAVNGSLSNSDAAQRVALAQTRLRKMFPGSASNSISVEHCLSGVHTRSEVGVGMSVSKLVPNAQLVMSLHTRSDVNVSFEYSNCAEVQFEL